MASSRLCGHGGKLYADDVLYYSGRMDAVLFLQLFCGEIYRAFFRRSGGGFWRYLRTAGSQRILDDGCGSAGDSDLLHGASERSGTDYQRHDDWPFIPNDCNGSAGIDSGGRHERPSVLSVSGF